MKLQSAIVIVLLLFTCPVHGAPIPAIEKLFAKLDNENRDIQLSQYNVAMKEENVTAARALFFPTFTGLASAGKSKAFDTGEPSGTISGGSTPATQSGLPTSNVQTDGLTTQVSSTYYLFTGFSGYQGYRNSKTDLESSELTLDSSRKTKRAQLLQLLLEWQWLNSIQPQVASAADVISQVRTHSRQSALLFTDDDQLDMNVRESELAYQRIKIEEGLSLNRAALLDLIPTLSNQELSELPQIKIEYPLPDEAMIRERFNGRSSARKILLNDVIIADRSRFAASFQRPWIPIVALTGSYSALKKYGPEQISTSWSSALVLTFNLFDGFYTGARREQSGITLLMAETRLESESSKRIIELLVHRSKALVSESEYKHRMAIARSKELKLQEVTRKQKQGVATQLERSLTQLDFVKSKMEALESLKNLQSASLTVAVELGDWEKVSIHEATH